MMLQCNGAYRYIKPTRVSRKKSSIVPFKYHAVSELCGAEMKICFDSLYRVILRYNDWEDDRKTAKLIKRNVRMISYEWAMEVTKKAKMNDIAIIVTVPKEDAKIYMDRLLMHYLDVFIEQA